MTLILTSLQLFALHEFEQNHKCCFNNENIFFASTFIHVQHFKPKKNLNINKQSTIAAESKLFRHLANITLNTQLLGTTTPKCFAECQHLLQFYVYATIVIVILIIITVQRLCTTSPASVLPSGGYALQMWFTVASLCLQHFFHCYYCHYYGRITSVVLGDRDTTTAHRIPQYMYECVCVCRFGCLCWKYNGSFCGQTNISIC